MTHHSIYHNSRSDGQYRAATGLSRAEFTALYKRFAPQYVPKTPGVYPSPSPLALTDRREALFFILHYYKAYPTLQNLGLYFGFSNATASRLLERLKPCLYAALVDDRAAVKRLFADQTAFDAAFDGVVDLVVDVTEVPIERADSYEVQKSQYSGKKTTHVKMPPCKRAGQAAVVCQQALRWSRPRLHDVQGDFRWI